MVSVLVSVFVKPFGALRAAEEVLERAPMVLSGGTVALLVRIVGDASWRAEQELAGGVLSYYRSLVRQGLITQ